MAPLQYGKLVGHERLYTHRTGILQSAGFGRRPRQQRQRPLASRQRFAQAADHFASTTYAHRWSDRARELRHTPGIYITTRTAIACQVPFGSVPLPTPKRKKQPRRTKLGFSGIPITTTSGFRATWRSIGILTLRRLFLFFHGNVDLVRRRNRTSSHG